MSHIGTRKLLILDAVERDEFTYDGNLTHGIAWKGAEADYDMSATVSNLRCDGFVNYDPDAKSWPTPVALTPAGERELP